MNKTYLIILIFALLPLHFYGQNNYKPATVVLLNQTQLKGEIDYKEWGSNPKSFSFRDGNEKQILSVNEVASFNIEGLETFERFVLTTKYSGKTKSIEDIKFGDRKSFTDTIFIRLVTSGKFVNLYVYESKTCTRFFIKENQKDKTSELLYDEYYPDASQSNIAYSKKYTGQLSLLARDPLANNQQKVAGLLEKASYSYDFLTKIINLLNAEKVTKSNTKFAIKPFAGIYLQQSSISYSGETPFADAPRNTSLMPGVNIGLDFYTNNNIRKYLFRTELSLGASKFETTMEKVVSQNQLHVYYHKFNQFQIGLAPQFLANIYNKEKIKINAGIGLGFNYSFFSNSEYYTINTFYGNSNKQEQPFEYKHVSLFLPLRAGLIIHKKMDIFGKYNLPLSSNSNYLAREFKIAGVQIGINYLF